MLREVVLHRLLFAAWLNQPLIESSSAPESYVDSGVLWREADFLVYSKTAAFIKVLWLAGSLPRVLIRAVCSNACL